MSSRHDSVEYYQTREAKVATVGYALSVRMVNCAVYLFVKQRVCLLIEIRVKLWQVA